MSQEDLQVETEDYADEKALEGSYDRIKAIETAHEALVSRKRLTMRLQIFLSFFLIVLIVMGIAVTMVMINSRVEQKLKFLEIADEFTVEIIQARRFEKNFFLYGTNLNDALENVYQARQILKLNERELKNILRDTYNVILANIRQYQELLESLVGMPESAIIRPDQISLKKERELGLRKHGREMVSIAQNLIKRENMAVSNILSRSRSIHIYSLILLVIYLALNAFFLSTRLLGNIKRFSNYAQRIASGDFTPIIPAKRYRDEFTDLAIAVNQMILQLENREAELIQSHKMRAVGTLTAGVAHELNNPLNNITLTAETLQLGYKDLTEDEIGRLTQDILDQADRASLVVKNLLEFSRMEEPFLMDLNIKETIEKTIELIRNQIMITDIELEKEIPDNLPPIKGKRQDLEHAFLNILLNGMQAMPDGGLLSIRADMESEDYIRLDLSDTGTGIKPSDIEHIFDPFFSTKEAQRGTGLGLSLVYKTIRTHGGYIEVKSEINKGTTFSIYLPVVKDKEKDFLGGKPPGSNH